MRELGTKFSRANFFGMPQFGYISSNPSGAHTNLFFKGVRFLFNG